MCPTLDAALDLLHDAALFEDDDGRQILDVEVLGELRRAIHVDAAAGEDAVILPLLQHLVEKGLDAAAGTGFR